jgi:serine/threonine-protein kinase
MKVMPDPAFKRLGKYEIQAELGRGGFGTVFRAFDPTVGRLVAIKVLLSEAGKDLVTRFRTEATAAGNLRHENIVTIYEFGDDKGLAFIAMEYLEGEDLQQVLATGKSLTLLEKISIMTQAAAGLDCAHRNGVVHRDVKPANIRLLPDGRVKIMDFGIARLIRDAGVARLTRRGHLLGTLLYMAPEQLMGSDTDALSDIFAYGVTFYELLTGRHPFQADDPRSVFYKITSEDPELIHELVPDCPETLDHVIRRALHKDRELRYQTLRDLRVDIEPVLTALRKECADELVTDAHQLVADRSFEHALALLNEAIDLDSANHAARQLRDSVQTELRRRLIRPRIEALLAKADRCLEDGNHNEAVQTMEIAVQLDSQDPGLQTRLRDAQQRRDQARESRRLLAEARADFAQGSLALALHKVSEAIALSPKSADAQSLLGMVRDQLDKRERQKRLHEKLRQARELLLLSSLDEALTVMNTLEAEDRDAPEARELTARLEAQKADLERRERLNCELATANAFLDGGQFIHAVQVLQRLRPEFPDEPRIARLLSQAQQKAAAFERAQAIERIQAEVLTCAEAKRFDDAVDLLTSATERYPDDAGLLRLRDTVNLAKSAWQRQQAIEQTVRRCEALADDDRFDEALAVLGETRREHPDDATLERIERGLESEREKFRRAQAVLSVLENANRLIEQRQPERAVADLEAALTDLPDERLRSALAHAQQALAVKERAAQIDRLEREVARYLEKQEFDVALQALDRASDTLAGEPALARLRDSVIAARAAAIASAASAADALTGAGRPNDALALLERTQTENGASPELDDAFRRARAAIAAQERERALAEVADAVRSHLRSNEFDRALAAIGAVEPASATDPRLHLLRAEISSAQEAWTAVQQIAAAVRECERLCAEEKYEAAFDAAEAALKMHPDVPELTAAQMTALAGLDRQNRRAEIAECTARAAELTSAGKPEKAVELIAAIRNRLGSDPKLEAALADAVAAIEARQRHEAVAAAVERARDDAAANRFAEALAWLDSVEADWGTDESISAARQAILDARDECDRQREVAEHRQRQRAEGLRTAVSQAVEQVADLIAAGNVAEAGRALQKALRNFPDQPELIAVQQRLKVESDRQRRAQATRRAAENARALLAKKQITRAIELLEAAAAQYPDDPLIVELLASARAVKPAGRQTDAVEAACRKTKTYLERNDFDSALKTVAVNLETHTGEPRLIALRETVLAARLDFERNAARKRSRSVAQAVTDDPSMFLPPVEPDTPSEPPVPRPPKPRSSANAERPAPTARPRNPYGRKIAFAGVVCAGALAAAFVGVRMLRPGAVATSLTVESEPAGAAVKIGDRTCATSECRFDLPAGNYRVDATLPGYAAASQAVTIRKGEAAHVRLALAPLPTSALVTCNFAGGSVELDGSSAGEMKDGQLALDNVKPGRHQLRVTSPEGEASLSFKSGVAQLPELIGDIASRDAGAVVVTSLGSRVRAVCSRCEGKTMLDGKPLQGQSVESGAHELTARMASGETQRLFFRTSEAPAIAVHLTSTVSTAGTLVVETNVDGASVSIDRRALGRQTEGGRIMIPLEPRNYRVEIRKPGYRVTPDHVTARIHKGDQFRAEFRLEPIPAAVTISAAAEGATVLIDGTPAGSVRGGSFSVSVAPGAHTVSLAKEGFKTASTQRSFTAGETVRLNGSALPLEALPQPAKQQPQPAQPSAEEIEIREWASVRSARDRAAIQTFLQKHPNGPHTQDAQQMLAQIEWDVLDRKDRSALERFATRYRGTQLAEQANSEIARIDRETTIAANAAAAEAAARRAEEQAGADRNEIARVLSAYATAFEKKDLGLLKTIWPDLPEASLAQAFRVKGGIHSQLRPVAPIEFTGDRANVRCVRVTEQATQFGRQKPFEEARTVRLRRENGRWIISAID